MRNKHHIVINRIKITPISEDISNFLNKYHLQKNLNNYYQICIGGYNNNQLIAIITFGQPRMRKSTQWELIRYYTHPDYIIDGSILLKEFENEFKPDNLVSYCNLDHFSGKFYEKNGFKKISESRTQIFRRGEQEYSLYQVMRYGPDRLLKTKYGFDNGSNIDLFLKEGFIKVEGDLQATYIKEYNYNYVDWGEDLGSSYLNNKRAKQYFNIEGDYCLHHVIGEYNHNCENHKKNYDLWNPKYLRPIKVGYHQMIHKALDNKYGSLGYHHSEEAKEKISQNMVGKNVGKIRSEEAKEKYRKTSSNRKFSAETKEKIKQSKIGNQYRLGRIASEETKIKISESNIGKHSYNLGKKCSEETRAKISQSKKGFKISQETKEKISQSKKGKSIGRGFSAETKEKIRLGKLKNNQMGGRQYINNGVICKFVKDEDFKKLLLEGWMKGRLPFNNKY